MLMSIKIKECIKRRIIHSLYVGCPVDAGMTATYSLCQMKCILPETFSCHNFRCSRECNVEGTCRGPSSKHATSRASVCAEWNAVYAGHGCQSAGMWYCLSLVV